MAKKGRPTVDPLKNIAASGFIGYVEEEEEHSSDEPGVIWVDVERIQSNPYQHAEDINPDDFATLVESIKADGFLGALNVSPHAQEEGDYFLTGGGHQRRDAARTAGLTKIPVFVSDAPVDPTVLALRVARENTARVNTSMINLGNLYQQMIEEFGWTQEAIAQSVQKDRNHVKFALTAARSPEDIQDMLRQRPDSLRAMTYFRRLERVEDRKPIMERFLAGEIATEGVRQEVEAVLEQQHGGTKGDVSAPIVMSEGVHPLSVLPLPDQESVPLRSSEGQPLSSPLSRAQEPVPMQGSVVRVIETRVDHEDVQSQEQVQEPLSLVREAAVQESENHLQQMYVILNTLRQYKRSVFSTRPLTEAERRVLGEMTVLTQQLLDTDDFNAGV